jgi:hypothetical protein
MGNKRETVYTGKFFFGSESQVANLTFDSGSDWMFVVTDQCDNCQADKKVYSPFKSTTRYVYSILFLSEIERMPLICPTQPCTETDTL